MLILPFILVPVLDRILQPSASVILGPVWVTRGAERFSPKGAYHFITTLLLSTKDRLKQSKTYKQQVLYSWQILNSVANMKLDWSLPRLIFLFCFKVPEFLHVALQCIYRNWPKLKQSVVLLLSLLFFCRIFWPQFFF